MKVFSFEDLERRRVPRVSSFQLVVDRAREILTDSDYVYGGIFLGSTMVHDQPRVTSDVDVLIVPKSVEALSGCRVLCSGLVDYAASLHVPFSPIIVPFTDLGRGDHTITRAFYLHLKAAASRGGVFKENPLGVVSLDFQLPLAAAVRQTILRKREYVLNWVSSPLTTSPQYAAFCSYVLSIAPAVCLNMLYVHNREFNECSKVDVCDSYREVFKSPTARDALGLIVKGRERYEKAVRFSQTQWEPHEHMSNWNEREYTDYLRYIATVSSLHVMIFLNRNLRYLAEEY